MMMKDIPKPLNADERYMYAMVERLDALCYMVDSLVRYIADEKGVATENRTEEEVVVMKEVPVVEKEESDVEESDVEESDVEESEEVAEVEEIPNQCIGVTTRGTRCRNSALEGEDCCSTHMPRELTEDEPTGA